MRVIGTAGHVDHGKSTLVEALTGINPDRLKEERAREMTIDLGFAWVDLPGGERVGIVDVPGHRDFIENMLAGVGGVDAALFVVASDEGVMPQTREHLAILDLLQIPSGLIALTKIDLNPDPEWLEMVEMDIRQAVQGTVLEDAPVVRVSARKRTGLQELLEVLAKRLETTPLRPDLHRPRLPVDRVFTIPGFGTVVTGTLIDGQFSIGEEVEVLPGGLKGRIRGLQTHKEKESIAFPGSRTAINISGVDVANIQRGNTVVTPGKYQPTQRIDASIHMLKDASGPLKHSAEVKVFIGTAEVIGRIRLLGNEAVGLGQDSLAQIDLRLPVVTSRGDRFILRKPSPGETIGGGQVIDPSPKRRYKRFSKDVQQRLAATLEGTPEEILHQSSLNLGIVSVNELLNKSRLEKTVFDQNLQVLLDQQTLVFLDEGETRYSGDVLIGPAGEVKQLVERMVASIDNYHQTNPLRKGIPKEELKSRLRLPSRIFTALLKVATQKEQIQEENTTIRLPGHSIRFTPAQETKINALRTEMGQKPYSPPSLKESQSLIGEDLVAALLSNGELVQVSSEVIFGREIYEEMLSVVRDHLRKNGTITVAEFRDKFSTSRRYALGFLEHLDTLNITQREGDLRRLKERPNIRSDQ